jgi:hypothetical protein
VRKRDFLKHIQLLDAEDLRDELTTLYSQIKAVRDFYAMELGTDVDRKKIYEKAKLDIASKYSTRSRRKPRRPRIQKVNAIISKLEKESVLPFEMIDIYLFNSETAVDFIRKYRFESEPLRNTVINSFSKAVDQIVLEKMKHKYSDRCALLLQRASVYPWLFLDLKELYQSVY